jgi:hypothetical protein
MALGISRDKWGWPIPGKSIPTHPQGMHPYLSHSFYKPGVVEILKIFEKIQVFD